MLFILILLSAITVNAIISPTWNPICSWDCEQLVVPADCKHQHHHGDNRKYRQCRRQACYAVRDERPKAGDRDAPHLIRRHDPAGFSRAIRGDTRPLPGSDGAIFRHEFFAYRRSKSIRRRPQTRDPRAHRTVQQSLRRHDHKIPKRRGDRRYGKHFYQADGDDLHEETLALKRKR